MKERILNYIKKIDKDINDYKAFPKLSKEKINSTIEEHLVQISFFQHERFIHLIVTFLFTLITIGCVLFTIIHFNIPILILTILSFILLVPYIAHYYLLENNVQYMYKQYDKLVELKEKK